MEVMAMPLADGSGTNRQPPSHELVMRAMREFDDAPALRLTFEQAMRLLSLDSTSCHDVLDALVDVHLLERDATGRYIRGNPR
jgi:DNA-binding IclR family transcriptional regulator